MLGRVRGILLLAALSVSLGAIPAVPATATNSPTYQLFNLGVPAASGISRNGDFILGGGFLLQESSPGSYSVVNTASQLQNASAHDVNNSGMVAFPGGYFANGADSHTGPKPIPTTPLSDPNDVSGTWTPITAFVNDSGTIAGHGTCPPSSDPHWNNCGKVNNTQTTTGTEGYYFSTAGSTLTFAGIPATPSDVEPHSSIDAMNDNGVVAGLATTSTSQTCFSSTTDGAVEVFTQNGPGASPNPIAPPGCSDQLSIKAINDGGLIVGKGR